MVLGSLSDCPSWSATEHRGMVGPAQEAWADMLVGAAYFYETSNDLSGEIMSVPTGTDSCLQS